MQSSEPYKEVAVIQEHGSGRGVANGLSYNSVTAKHESSWHTPSNVSHLTFCCIGTWMDQAC
jgi:hypothetical protein